MSNEVAQEEHFEKLNSHQAKEMTLKSWTSQIIFFISLITVVATFFKFVYDIKDSMDASVKQVQTSMDASFKEMSKDMKADYASKQEVQFLRDTVLEIKSDVKETKGDLKETKGRLDGTRPGK